VPTSSRRSAEPPNTISVEPPGWPRCWRGGSGVAQSADDTETWVNARGVRAGGIAFASVDQVSLEQESLVVTGEPHDGGAIRQLRRSGEIGSRAAPAGVRVWREGVPSQTTIRSSCGGRLGRPLDKLESRGVEFKGETIDSGFCPRRGMIEFAHPTDG
jgi:hypothetical protein